MVDICRIILFLKDKKFCFEKGRYPYSTVQILTSYVTSTGSESTGSSFASIICSILSSNDPSFHGSTVSKWTFIGRLSLSPGNCKQIRIRDKAVAKIQYVLFFVLSASNNSGQDHIYKLICVILKSFNSVDIYYRLSPNSDHVFVSVCTFWRLQGAFLSLQAEDSDVQLICKP